MMTALHALAGGFVLAGLAAEAAPEANANAANRQATFPECLDRPVLASGRNGEGFEREPARPGDGQAIYAVDRRENGCPVLVKMGRPATVQPAPKPAVPMMIAAPDKRGQ